MADRPILADGQSVRAMLAGRKSQMRFVLSRLKKRGRITEFGPSDTQGYDWHFRDRQARWHDVRTERLLELLPYAVGDRLWVREVAACGACAPSIPSLWAPSFWRREQGTPKNPSGLWYEADDRAPEKPITDPGEWQLAAHMPRWASRLTLTVTDVRVQRLQDISDDDVLNEGITLLSREPACTPSDNDEEHAVFFDMSAKEAFERLWHNINGPASWDANPWVVALTFTVERQNIDATEAQAA